MTRNRFGGSAADWLLGFEGDNVVKPPADYLEVTYWSGPPSSPGRTQYTDLQLLDGTPVTEITAAADGQIPEHFGPDDVEVTRMWASATAGTTGVWVTTSTFDAVGFSGVYADLSGKPAIPSTAGEVGAETPAGAQAKADAAAAASVPLTQKGAASGVAPLDAGSRVAEANLPAGLAASALSATFASGVESTPTIADSFVSDTAAGGIGSPEVGPGGAWNVTGPGVAGIRILGGVAVSPSSVSYAWKLLAATPAMLRQRFTFRTGGAPSATMSWVANQTSSLSIAGIDMVHLSVTRSFISLTVWNAGASNTPANNGPSGQNGVVTLADDVEYEFIGYIRGNTVHGEVYRVSDGARMGTYDGSDPLVSTKAGPLVYFEPGPNAEISLFSAHPEKAVKLPFRIHAPGGLSGPVGLGASTDAGYFKRVAIGTQQPTGDFHVVSPDNVHTQLTGSHASGSFARVTSSVSANAGLILQANSSATPAQLYQVPATNEFRLKMGATDRIEVTASGQIKFGGPMYPPDATSYAMQSSVGIYAGTVVPTNATGTDGSLYVRGGNQSAGSRLYMRLSGTWTGIL